MIKTRTTKHNRITAVRNRADIIGDIRDALNAEIINGRLMIPWYFPEMHALGWRAWLEFPRRGSDWGMHPHVRIVSPHPSWRQMQSSERMKLVQAIARLTFAGMRPDHGRDLIERDDDLTYSEVDELVCMSKHRMVTEAAMLIDIIIGRSA